MDDVWVTKVWDDVKRFFPDDNNGSRIVLTSRLTNVGVHATSFDRLHDMSFLSSNESWNLFCEKAFGGESCPPDLEEIGWQIIRNCKGLPLSIVVVGGLLSMDKTAGYWKTIATTLNTILATDGGQCSTIFSLSYNHLPAHLKPCFLYFAVFPEDYIIRRSNIIKLWVAEGFVRPNESNSLEDIAEEYLKDLANRSLVMVLEMGYGGKVKTYGIHDLIRDFCIREVQKEKFLHVPNKYPSTLPKGIKSERRVSIQAKTLDYIEHIYNSDGPVLLTRSLLCYHSFVFLSISKLASFRLLRILAMARIWFDEFPIEVVKLWNLRYLSLLCFKAIVPASISSIWCLQTLIIDTIRFDTSIHLPQVVWKMPHLRHVRIRRCYLPDPPCSEIEGKIFITLANLQTLSEIINFRFTDEIIKRIPKVRKLKVRYDMKCKDWSQYHLSNIVCLNELEILETYSLSKIVFRPNFKFSASLKKLYLFGGLLRWEDMTIVGSLHNLEVLILRSDACEGKMWEPNEGEFCELKFLTLDLLDLVHWRADYYHFPKLRCLKIGRCSELKEIPIEIGNIPTLEKIELDDENPGVVASAKLILDEQRSFGNGVLEVHIKNRDS